MKSTLLPLICLSMLLAVLPVSATNRYVNVNNATPTLPYTSWATAANVIQDAIDVANAGDTVLVTNGVYSTGGKVVRQNVQQYLTNRVAVDKPLTLRSVNGPAVTIIQGYQVPGTITGDGAVRCVYMTNDVFLSGFTLTGGATLASSFFPLQLYGGGLLCESTNAWVSNCVVTGNSASESGGGAQGGTFNRCIFTGNSAIVGAGAFFSTLNNCIFMDNVAVVRGGGTMASTLNNCTVIGNSAIMGGGSYYDVVNNSIVYFNTSSVFGPNEDGSELNYCCTAPLPPAGIGNITNAPFFIDQVGGNLRLSSNSSCINAGNNSYVTSPDDFDGNSRIVGGTVDIGAYEFQSPQSLISYAWLRFYGLPTDGSADFIDGDTDSANTWQEWKTWTNPTNDLSVLRMLNPQSETNGTLVSWESVSGHSYLLERATHLSEPFLLIQSNIVGQAEITSVTDTNATNSGPFLYRVAVPE